MSEDNFPVVVDYTPAFTTMVTFTYDDERYIIKNNKLYNSLHEVAVVYSPGYGGGWSSWHVVDPTDARVAILTLTSGTATLSLPWYADEDQDVRIMDRKFYPYAGSDLYNDLAIRWLPGGTLFKIEEYDGAESIVTSNEMNWDVA